MKATSAGRAFSAQDWPATRYIDRAEIEAVARVLGARSPFRYYGPDLQHETDQFEVELARYVGSRFCLGVGSGTAGLHVAIAALGIGPGDEVVLPGYFWVSTVAAIVNNGAVPVLADVDASLSLDPDDLERKLTPRTKAVIMIHMGGVVGQIERIAAICRRRSIALVEDCAQSLGASKAGVNAGRFGDIGVFSFQLNKSCTAGEGGAIVTNDEGLFQRAVAIHDAGYLRDSKGNPDSSEAGPQLWGLGCRMNELTAAVLRVQLGRLPALLDEMRFVKAALTEIIRAYPHLDCVAGEDPGGDPGTLLTLRFGGEDAARGFQQSLFVSALKAKLAVRTVPLTDYGLHLYYQNSSLVKKRSICGHHSVWQRVENEFARDYSYAKGALPVLDSFVSRTLLFATPVGLSIKEQEDLQFVFRSACDRWIDLQGGR